MIEATNCGEDRVTSRGTDLDRSRYASSSGEDTMTSVVPPSGKGEQRRPSLLADRRDVYQAAFWREKRGSESECFRRDLVDGCEAGS